MIQLTQVSPPRHSKYTPISPFLSLSLSPSLLSLSSLFIIPMAIPTNAYYLLDSHPSQYGLRVDTPRSNSTGSRSVKSELSSSPHLELSPSPLHSFSFCFPPSSSAPTTAQLNPNFTTATSTSLPIRPYYRFGSMAHNDDSWIGKRSGNLSLNLNAMSFPDEYDDGDELADLPNSAGMPSASSGHSDRVVRRRSSKGMSLHCPFNSCIITRHSL